LDKPILITFNIGKFYMKLKLLSYFNLHADWTISTSTLHKIKNTDPYLSFYTETNASMVSLKECNNKNKVLMEFRLQ
jgi:hypothetical protein